MKKQWIYEIILAVAAVAIVLYGFYFGYNRFMADDDEEKEPGYSEEYNEQYGEYPLEEVDPAEDEGEDES